MKYVIRDWAGTVQNVEFDADGYEEAPYSHLFYKGDKFVAGFKKDTYLVGLNRAELSFEESFDLAAAENFYSYLHRYNATYAVCDIRELREMQYKAMLELEKVRYRIMAGSKYLVPQERQANA